MSTNYRKLVFLVLSLQILFVFAACGLASAEESDGAEEIPSLPLVLQGGMTVNGAPVSEGSEIQAYYEGNPIGNCKVETEGQLNLILNLAPDNYENFENVEFYIDGNKAELGLQEADLEAIKNSEGLSGPVIAVSARSSVVSSSGSGGSDSSGDDEKALDKAVSNDAPEGGEAEEPAGDEEVLAVPDEPVKAGEDTKGGMEYSDDQPVFWVILAIAAILGVVLVMRKMLVG